MDPTTVELLFMGTECETSGIEAFNIRSVKDSARGPVSRTAGPSLARSSCYPASHKAGEAEPPSPERPVRAP